MDSNLKDTYAERQRKSKVQKGINKSVEENKKQFDEQWQTNPYFIFIKNYVNENLKKPLPELTLEELKMISDLYVKSLWSFRDQEVV